MGTNTSVDDFIQLLDEDNRILAAFLASLRSELELRKHKDLVISAK
jgi:hypothetical protein